MPPKTKTPTAGTVGAGNIILFPARKVSPSKITPLHRGFKVNLIASAERLKAQHDLIVARQFLEYEPSEENHQAAAAAGARLIGLLGDGGGYAA